MSTVLDYTTGPIEVEIDLAIGRQADAGVWDSSTWDYGAVWGAGEHELGDWVDVTCDVLEVDVTAGASAPDGLITQVNATTGSVTFRGPQWNPWGSSWAGVLGPSVPVRGRWRRPAEPPTDWLPWFAGVSDGWPYDRQSMEAAVPFVDGTGDLANYKMLPQAAPVGDHETVSARMNRVLDAARWPADQRDIPAGGVTTIPTLLEGPAWDLISVAADTDLGIVWLDRSGRVAFRPVGQAGQWLPDPVPFRLVDTAGLDPDDVCVINYTRADPLVVRNDVTVSHAQLPIDQPPAVPQVRITDDASIQRFRAKTYTRTDLIHDTDAWSATVAAVILQSGAWPEPHPQTADLDIRADTRVADLLLSTEIAQTIDALDTGKLYRCVVVGYTTQLTLRQLTGSLVLEDVTAWIAGRWDSAQWDYDRWGV